MKFMLIQFNMLTGLLVPDVLLRKLLQQIRLSHHRDQEWSTASQPLDPF